MMIIIIYKDVDKLNNIIITLSVANDYAAYTVAIIRRKLGIAGSIVTAEGIPNS